MKIERHEHCLGERGGQEEQAQNALAYLENIIATLREPFVVLDKSLRVKMANRSFYRTFHVSQEDTDGRLIYDLGDRQWDIPRLRTLLEEVLPRDHFFSDFEVRHDFPAIGTKIMLLNARRFVSADRGPELILLAMEDVTERRKAEVAVQTSEVRYRRLFQTAKDGILILDAKTLTIIDSNPFMTEMLGYAHDELLGKELWEIGLVGDRQASQVACRELQEKGYVRYDHLPLETKNGEPVEVEFVSNVYQVDRVPIAQCNIRDVGERARWDKQIRQQAAELADLHRRKDEFLATLSHELRNPLAAIMSAVQVLGIRKATEDRFQTEARGIIERQTGQLKRLVDDLLEVSRISTGRVLLRPERVTVNGIVEHAVETARPAMEHRKHELTVSMSPRPIWLHADALRLEQVVVNLLANAAKYTADGGHIWLTVQQEAASCVLRVRDTGEGIAPELVPRIFDLFTQAEQSLDRSQGGLGIGLALVRQFTEMHGGTVEVSSILGQGSEFVVRLPVASRSAAPSPWHVTEAAQLPARPVRVMVVDDNEDAAKSLAMLLEASGHSVRTAHDGPTTLETAPEYRPDVVLLDIGLPGLDGFEVAKQIRKHAVLQQVMLVALTGYGQDAERQRSREAGFAHYLVKPAELGKLQEILAIVSQKAM